MVMRISSMRHLAAAASRTSAADSGVAGCHWAARSISSSAISARFASESLGACVRNPWITRALAALRRWPSVVLGPVDFSALARLAASFAGLKAIFFLVFDSMVNFLLPALS
jgi:hypothetical protein